MYTPCLSWGYLFALKYNFIGRFSHSKWMNMALTKISFLPWSRASLSTSHEGKGGRPKKRVGGKEGQRLDHWKQFGRDLVLVIVVQVEGGEEVPFRAELGHRQETGGESSDLEERSCLMRHRCSRAHRELKDEKYNIIFGNPIKNTDLEKYWLCSRHVPMIAWMFASNSASTTFNRSANLFFPLYAFMRKKKSAWFET